MPRIVLGRDTEKVPDNLVNYMQPMLKRIVAEELTCRGFDGSLAPDDIEVRVEDFGPLDDNGPYNLTVNIWATEFSDRRVNLNERREKIVARFRAMLDKEGHADLIGYVWVLLQPTSFGKF